MDPDRWDQIQTIFKSVVQAPPALREALLRQACHGDADLQAEVQALIVADSDTVSLLDGVAADAVELVDDLSLEGTFAGPYRLERLLATGGMGAVYLASRSDGDSSVPVALKLIRQGMDSDQILRRFHTEREILGRLKHPNIARLLGGGTTEGDKPWFALEYVDGEPIDEYCDRRQLPIPARLRLFGTVCSAVSHAHARQIVHRDLKPANILVTGDDSGGPQVKLLDFGIAKALGDAAADLTRTGSRIMTPAYASPEQVRGERVGTATDIYSLGVVLFELLTGQLPYPIRGTSKLEIASIIATAEPERPSTVVCDRSDPDGAAALEALAHARSTRPDRLRLQLSGDLDGICMQALRKQVLERYASVEALAADVQRHLEGIPRAERTASP